MTEAELKELERLDEQRTKGLWIARLNSDHPTAPPQIDVPHEAGFASMPEVTHMMWMCHASGKEAEDAMVKQTEDDCLFIVAVANAIPHLLSMIREQAKVIRTAHDVMCRATFHDSNTNSDLDDLNHAIDKCKAALAAQEQTKP